MKRLLALALVSAGVAAAPLDMALFKAHDLDGDGYVDIIEVMGSNDLQARFNDVDTDRDRRLSAAEMQAWIDRPDKPDLLRNSAPLLVHEQWRELERRRAQRAREAQQPSPPAGEAARPAAAAAGSQVPTR